MSMVPSLNSRNPVRKGEREKERKENREVGRGGEREGGGERLREAFELPSPSAA